MSTRFICLSAIVTVLTLACGSNGSKQDSSNAAAGPASATATHNDSSLRIAVIAKSSTNPIFLAARTGAETAATELGAKSHLKIEILWLTPPQEDVGRLEGRRPAFDRHLFCLKIRKL